jgi:hypothetical protein
MAKAATKRRHSFEESAAARMAADERMLTTAARALRDIDRGRTISLRDLPKEVAKRKRNRPTLAARDK